MQKCERTMDNILEGGCNTAAYHACLSVINDTEGQLLVLSGPNACGKSYLLSALKNTYQKKYPDRAVKMTNYHDLFADFVEALHTQDVVAFQKRISGHDLLIVDNMQFIAGKEATQQAFAGWLGELLDRGGSAAIALDRDARCVEPFLSALGSRHFHKIRMIEMKTPDRTVREKLLAQLAADSSVKLSAKVCEAVVNCMQLPICAFKGLLLRLEMLKKLNSELTEQEMMDCLAIYTANKP